MEVEKKNKKTTKIIKDVRNLSRLKNENEAIKNRINKDIKNLFENYYKPEEDHYKKNYYKTKIITN